MLYEVRERMWARADKRLGMPAFAAKVFKFILTTSILMQFRHLDKTPVSINDGEEQALVEDGC